MADSQADHQQYEHTLGRPEVAHKFKTKINLDNLKLSEVKLCH